MYKFLIKKKTFLSLLIFSIVFFCVGQYLPTNSQSVESLDQQIQDINNQISSDQANINALQSQVQSLLSQKNSVQSGLYNIENLLNQASAKEQNINSLINSFQSLKTSAENELAKEIDFKDKGLADLYENSQGNSTLLLISSSSDASSFLYTLALNEANLSNEKSQILEINSQIGQLQNSLNQENSEKAIQDKQISQLNSQKTQLQNELGSIQNSYKAANAQVSILQSQLGSLTSQEQSIIQAKINSSFSQTGGGSEGNTLNPGGNPGTFNLEILRGGGNVVLNSIQGPLIFKPNLANDYTTVSGNGNKGYFNGNIEFRANTDVNLINQTSMENYVKGIAEMPSNWSIEALKAQAIAARTYALYHRGENAGSGYDVSNTQSDQVYNGLGKAALQSNGNTDLNNPSAGAMWQAGDQTKGQVIYYNNSPIDALYSSNNGGYERSNSEVWFTSPYPYLPSQSDNGGSNQYDFYSSFCQGVFTTKAYGSTNGQINISGGIGSFYDMAGASTMSNPDLHTDYSYIIQNAIGNFDHAEFHFAMADGSTAIGESTMSMSQLQQITMSSNGNAHYTDSVILYGDKGNITIKGASFDGSPNFYTSFYLRSPGTDVLTNKLWYFTNGSSLMFYNSGNGHTIGMSQCGAYGRASISGQNANQILSFYYPNTNISTDSSIINTDPSSCSNIGSGYPNNDACIRVGVDGFSSSNNTLTENDGYTIYYGSNNSQLFQGISGDNIQIVQN